MDTNQGRVAGPSAVKLAASALSGEAALAFKEAWAASSGNLAATALALSLSHAEASGRAYVFGSVRADDPRAAASAGSLAPMLGEDPGALSLLGQHEPRAKEPPSATASKAAAALESFEAGISATRASDPYDRSLFNASRAARQALASSPPGKVQETLGKAAPTLESAGMRCPPFSEARGALLLLSAAAVDASVGRSREKESAKESPSKRQGFDRADG